MHTSKYLAVSPKRIGSPKTYGKGRLDTDYFQRFHLVIIADCLRDDLLSESTKLKLGIFKKESEKKRKQKRINKENRNWKKKIIKGKQEIKKILSNDSELEIGLWFWLISSEEYSRFDKGDWHELNASEPRESKKL